MKKLIIPLSLMTLAMIPTGCTPKDNNAKIANELSNNITELMESAKRVSDIDENKLTIDKLHDKTTINNDYKTKKTYTNNTIRKLAKNNQKANDGLYNKQTTFVKTNSNNGSNFSKNTAKNNSYNRNLDFLYTNDYNNLDNYVSDNGNHTNKYGTSEYNSRFTSNTENKALITYLEKIQDLHAICNDTCAASHDLDSLKSELITSCNNCNTLLKKVQNGEVSLTEEQKNTLCEYNNTLQGCINDLNSCKNCSEDVNLINSLKGNFSNNCDTLVAKYLKVLNNLDINGSYCNNAQCTVAEINNYISNICGEKVNNYVRRYKFDNYAIDNTPSNKTIDNNQPIQNKENKITTENTNTNTSNNLEKEIKNTQKTQPNTNYDNSNTANKQRVNNQSTPSRKLTPVYTAQNSNQKTQNNTQTLNNTKNDINKQNTPTTYPMPRPTNNNQKQNVYGGSAPKPVPEQNFPNRHPLTKDIKQNPNRQQANAQNSKNSGEVVTYNNRYNDSFAVSTPSPKVDYKQVSTNNQTNKTAELKTTTRKNTSKPTFTNKVLMFGPQNVRANKGIMTLEEM